jgi:hypothetical protein
MENNVIVLIGYIISHNSLYKYLVSQSGIKQQLVCGGEIVAIKLLCEAFDR